MRWARVAAYRGTSLRAVRCAVQQHGRETFSRCLDSDPAVCARGAVHAPLNGQLPCAAAGLALFPRSLLQRLRGMTAPSAGPPTGGSRATAAREEDAAAARRDRHVGNGEYRSHAPAPSDAARGTASGVHSSGGGSDDDAATTIARSPPAVHSQSPEAPLIPLWDPAAPPPPCAPRGGGGDGAGATPSAEVPTVVSAQHNITTDERLSEIVCELESRRVARQKKLFDDLIVFDGGAVADHDSLGHYLIMRDFVHFGLYHSKWGYYPKLFRKYRQLMTTGYFDPVPFGSLRSQYDYERYVTKMHETTPSFVTPSQLFQPFYGWVIAEYLVTTFRAKFDPREPLIIYDVGAGTGALAESILDYLAEHFPGVYARCQYHAIELNPYLVQTLRNKLVHHYHHVHLHHISILNWREVEKRRCVVLALELFSGLPHDCVLWDAEGTCSEHGFSFVQRDNLSTAQERYSPVRDPMILRYLRYLNWMQEESLHNLKVLCLTDGRQVLDPPRFNGIAPGMDDPLRVMATKLIWIHSPLHTAWLPTAQMLMLEVLAEYFPRHHLFAADWATVRQALPGVNGPVLQVKLRVARDLYLRRTVESLEGNAGMVDITFPTDFEHLATVYRRVCGPEKEITSMSHPAFWRTYGGDKTALFTTQSGFNPLLEDFAPFHVFATHHPPEL